MVAQFLYRYLFVISEEAQHMRKAAWRAAPRGRTGGQCGAIPRGGGRAGGPVCALVRARRRDPSRHAGARFSGILPAFDRVTLSAEADLIFLALASLDAGGIADAHREGGIMPPLVLVRGLRYQYDDGTVALNGVDFRLEAGETVALLGANGTGKTTFVLHLNGLLIGRGHGGSLRNASAPRTPVRRSGARSGWCFRIPKVSSSCRPCWKM